MIQCSVVLLACDRARPDVLYLGKEDTKDLTCDQARLVEISKMFGNDANFIAMLVGYRARVDKQSRWSITWSLTSAILNLRICNACSNSHLIC